MKPGSPPRAADRCRDPVERRETTTHALASLTPREQLGVRVKVLDAQVEEFRARQRQSDVPPTPSRGEPEARCEEIIACKDGLGRFADEYGRLVAGETTIGKIL